MRVFLGEVDHLLSRNDEPVRVVIAGGAAMLDRSPSRQTRDIDVVSEGMTDSLRHAAAVVAERHGLNLNWINDGAKLFAVNVELKPEPVFSGKRLVVEVAGPHYMLAMKLLSGRDSDEDDCVMLIREVGMYDPKDLLDFIESAAHPRQLRPRDAFWVLERLDEAKKGRRLRRIRQRLKRLLRADKGSAR